LLYYLLAMIIIGHRGAAGLAPENTIAALHKGRDVGADILEFDVRLTRDKVPIVIHDSKLLRTHGSKKRVRWSSHESIRQATEKGHKIATLKEVMDEFFGYILLNLEIKNIETGRIIAQYIEKNYIKKPSDWDAIVFSSFKTSELYAVRRVSSRANLAMLHDLNPFGFIAHHRQLQFSAVGFHRLHINRLALEIAKRAGIFTYVYTVNRPETAALLEQKGIDGIVTDNPDRMVQYLQGTTK